PTHSTPFPSTPLFRSHRRSDAPRAARPARRGGAPGEAPRRAVRHDPARRVAAPAGPARGRAGDRAAGRAGAPLPAARRAATRGRRVGGPLRAVLARPPGGPRRASGEDTVSADAI